MRSKTYLDETENTSNSEDSDNPEKCWTDREVGKHILQEDSHYRCKYEDEVKKIPWNGEVMVAQANDFHNRLCKQEIHIRFIIRKTKNISKI